MAASDAPQSWWAQLPPAEKAKAWEKVCPGSASVIIDEVVKRARHERRLAVAQIALQCIRLLFAGASVVLFAWLAKYFVDHGAATQGAGILVAGLVALVGAFLGQKAITEKSRIMRKPP